MRLPEADRRAAFEALAELANLLAEALLVPGTDVRAGAAALLPAARAAGADLGPVTHALVMLAEAPDGASEVEYARVLLHGVPRTAHPYESYYRTGMLADPETLADLEALFEAAGIQPDAPRPVPIDHLGLQLDLLALLLRGLGRSADGSARAAVAALATWLLDDHLCAFVGGFSARVASLHPDRYIAAVVAAVAAATEAADDLIRDPGAPVATNVKNESAHRAADSGNPQRSTEAPRTRRKEDSPMRRIIAVLAVLLLVPVFGWAQAEEPDAEQLRKDIQELEGRLEKVERKAAKDRINFTGDYRFEAHTIETTIPDHYDGMMLQNMIVNTIFYYGATGQLPQDMNAVSQFIAQNYGSYLYFTGNLTYEDLQNYLGMFPPEMQQALIGSLLPATYTPGYEANNSIMYTNRLRLGIDAEVAKDLKFTGRLSMYKVFGDSTGVQVFNGQSNSFSIDGNTVGVPNSDILRVERAYFDWSNIAGTGLYLSIGRRPSSGGPPLNLRHGELRAGSPMGSLIDFQFDGITVGYHLTDTSTFRICYGLGYESGYGNGEVLKSPADRLEDAQFAGINWDIYNDTDMLLQATVARAFNITDGFNGLIVLPTDPLTGNPINAPVVLRFTPSANLGDMDIAGIVLQRRDGPVDWFVNYNYVKSHPENVTTPFGGLFVDPFQVPEEQSGTMYYVGARYTLPNDKTMFGLEYNHGSEYWFNFTPAQDDIIGPKTNARGDVIEAYMIHKIKDKFMLRLAYIDYSYDYSGSGWQLGAPKPLDSTPVLGFPTYDSARMLTLGMTVRF